ncbi:hypothetical protein ACI8AC_25100 [Geodermatophilus sp. SYSU D00758]
MFDDLQRSKAAEQKSRQAPAAVSFIKCMVMAVADEYGTKETFGFDE